MKRNLLPLVIAMLFVTGTAFAQETPQPADGVVEAPVSPEAAVGSSDCCNPCCDPCDPCCNQRQGFFARMRARRCCETTCCNECTTTVQTACCDPCDPCCNQRKGLFARMRDRRCCETTTSCNDCATTVETACCDPCDPCCNQRKGLFARMRDRRCCEPTCNTCETTAMAMPEMTTTAAVAPTTDCGTCQTDCCKPRRRTMFRRRNCCN